MGTQIGKIPQDIQDHCCCSLQVVCVNASNMTNWSHKIVCLYNTGHNFMPLHGAQLYFSAFLLEWERASICVFTFHGAGSASIACSSLTAMVVVLMIVICGECG